MAMKINKLEIENVKRVKAVKAEFTPNGLTVIGGNNNQGKTSILDAIAWALGGNKYKPSQAQRQGSVTPPHLHVVMNNGLIVERSGKNSTLKVIDPNGKKGGQQLLNDFVEELAINLPKFMESTSKEKANTLLQIIGVGPKLQELEMKEGELYNERRTIGQIADQKKKFAEEQTYYPDAPHELISIKELVNEQQDILARNGENQRKRDNLSNLEKQHAFQSQKVAQLMKELEKEQAKLAELTEDVNVAKKSVLELKDESTEELERNLAEIDEINRKVRANLDKDKYQELTRNIESVRKEKADLLNSADLPLPELSVDNGELIYKGQKWDNMSGSDQLKVSTAIVRKLKPNCGFILLDKLEQMDMQTLEEFNHWLEQEQLQGIATRVSTGDECSIIIEDGYATKNNIVAKEPEIKNTWTGKGAF